MNFHELTPIEAKRVDPITGNLYTFKAAPPIDLTLLAFDSGSSYPDFILTFFWRVLAGGWDTSTLPDLHQQVSEVLPVLLMVAEDMSLQLEGEEENINLSVDQSFTISINRGSVSRWQGVTPAPSAELLAQLDEEVLTSPALALATRMYITKVFSELIEETQQSDEREEFKKSDHRNQSEPTAEGYIKYGIHAVVQQFNPKPKDSSITPQLVAQDWQETTGEVVNQSILKFGMDLTEIESRVTEGLLRKLTETNYKGNVEPTPVGEMLTKFTGIDNVEKLPKVLQNITHIPRLQIGKRELVGLAGMDYNDQRDVERVVLALNRLAHTQYCFYYSRMAMVGGKPQVDKNGKIAMEDVYAVSTLFELKVIFDKEAQKLKHYEIQPGPILLDQKEGYYMLIPFDWRKEVKALVGEKKASKYLYLFLIYLRYQFEQKRRKNANSKKSGGGRGRHEYQIKCSWVSIAQAISMPESVYRGKKERALNILQEAFATATQLGYLKSNTQEGDMVNLALNPTKYYQAKSDLREEIPA